MTVSSFERSTSQLQQWSADLYDTHARFVGDLAANALALLGLQQGERVLDLGCGDGYLTQKLVGLGAEVVGLDYSPELAAAARQRGLDVAVGNAEELPYVNQFDAVFSNAAMHWMRRADRVARGVRRALRPGGRFVGEFAGAGNARLIRAAVHGELTRRGIDAGEVDPWYLPEEDEYRAVLEDAGFEVSSLRLFDRPVVIDYPIGGWIRTFGSPYLTVLPKEDREDFLQCVTAALRSDLLGADGRWTVDYTRLRFRAESP